MTGQGGAQPETERGGAQQDRRSGQQGGQREQKGGQREQQGQRDRDRNTGQGGREGGSAQRDRESGQKTDRGERDRDQKQGGRDSDTNRAQQKQNSQRDRGDNTGSTTNVQINTEQKTRIRERRSALSAGRVDRVDFTISVGTVVPRTVRVYELPATIVEIVPRYRGYKYILVDDEILIIDPRTLRIVAVIDA